MSLPYDRTELTTILTECVRRSGFDDAYVEMICTRGVSPTFSRDPRDAVNRFIAFAIPFGWVANEEQRARGLHIVISQVSRIPPESVDPTVKNYHWLDLVAGMFEAYDRGAENVVLVGLDGNLTEGPGFNLFVVKDGAVATPARGVLEGITRQTALDLCAELGITAAARPIEAATVKAADEVFITSTAGGIMPVTRVDDAAVGDGKPGPVTGRLLDLYWQKHADPDWTTPVD
jgi:branched-chain amino acid aminotransferase